MVPYALLHYLPFWHSLTPAWRLERSSSTTAIRVPLLPDSGLRPAARHLMTETACGPGTEPHTHGLSIPKPQGVMRCSCGGQGSVAEPPARQVDINHLSGSTRVVVNQRLNAGKWNTLGTYQFGSSGSVTIIASTGSTVSTCADAVRFVPLVANVPPTAIIDSISPNPAEAGQVVSFIGQGDDDDGQVAAWVWESNIDGELSRLASFSTSSLSIGNHTITFRVQDNENAWSQPVSQSLTITEESQPTAPTAAFSSDRTTGSVPTLVQFYDESSGEVTGWSWNFGDGQSSTAKNPSHTYSAAGKYTVSLTASNSTGSDTEIKTDYITITTAAASENIYLVDGYSKNAIFLSRCYNFLKELGATQIATGKWVYNRAGKTYNITSVHDVASMKAALREEGSHIIFNGHSNFGLGATFGSWTEVANQQINNIYYVNDDRFVNYSTKMVSLKTDGVRYGQAYPNWNPVFKNGKSASMPYTFTEGTPPYNYILAYKRPGDTTVYRVELSDGSYLQRFPDSNTPAWFSPDGSLPDPVKNPEYFITNPDPGWSRCAFTGTWPATKIKDADPYGTDGYLGYNYQSHSAGTGNNKATFTVYVKHPGTYSVMASWFPSLQNASNAKFTINHASGSTTVEVDQRTSVLMNPLGVYYFNQGNNTIVLSDNANGTVVADAVIVQPVDGPSQILQAEFGADKSSGAAPLNVQFSDFSEIYVLGSLDAAITSWQWNFGDGSTSTLQNPAHTYSSPGMYTVRLTVTDASGNQAFEEKTGVIVVGNTAAPVRAEFTAAEKMGSDKTIVKFADQSTGNITSWKWDFGDGTTSNERNPMHVYTTIGSFNVTLTVSGPGGSDSETEASFVTNLVGVEFIDNTFVEKPHFYSGSTIKFGKVIVDTGDIRMRPEEMKFSRMFYGGCNASAYYVETFSRGIFFFTKQDESFVLGPEYLKRYLLGNSDDQILNRLNSISPIYEYYNFNLKPPSMR